MSKINGQRVICDRCGAETFVKCTGEKERDGGFTRWNTFENLPEGWSRPYLTGVTDLCPTCTAEWEKIQEEFKKTEERFCKEVKND